MTATRENIARGTVLIVALITLIFAVNEAEYLLRGYSLSMRFDASFEQRGATTSHIDFPIWLGLVHGVIYLAIFVTLVLTILFRHQALLLAWLTFLAALLVGVLDVYQYGTIGSPTSIKTILLILILAALTTYWRRTGLLR